MGYEIDVLAVGKASNSGDALAIRYGNLHGDRSEQTVIIIDGGYKADGQRLVDHIKEHYKTEKVDLVISTHPDQDHINGLAVVLEELEVSELWIHKAWEHNSGLSNKFQDGRITDNSIGNKLKESLEAAYKLVKQAERKNITVREPFTGQSFGNVKVLGPSLEYYEELLPQFDGMPVTKQTSEASFDIGILKGWLENAAEKVFMKISAVWGEDQIDNKDTTSAKNNSSVITQIIVDNRRLLFTADAGITALDKAADQIDACISGAELRFIQIPHHGSKRNVGPDVLNRIIGEPVTTGTERNISAIASTAKEGAPKHPHSAVLNAFKHRGIPNAIGTKGIDIRHYFNAPERAGWSALAQEPYQYEYDEEV